jgi:type IV pilus assembly protein PilA
MKRIMKRLKGFTLLELMITVAIVAILAAIAVPSYLNYTRRSYYTEVVSASGPFKIGIAECYHETGTLTGCSGGSNHIPPNITSATGAVATATAADGVITITPVDAHGILGTDTYILTPTVVNNELTWSVSGGGLTSGYV